MTPAIMTLLPVWTKPRVASNVSEWSPTNGGTIVTRLSWAFVLAGPASANNSINSEASLPDARLIPATVSSWKCAFTGTDSCGRVDAKNLLSRVGFGIFQQTTFRVYYRDTSGWELKRMFEVARRNRRTRRLPALPGRSRDFARNLRAKNSLRPGGFPLYSRSPHQARDRFLRGLSGFFCRPRVPRRGGRL